MGQVSGVIEAVSEKSNKHPKYGTSYNIRVKVDGEWYGSFFKQSAAKLGLAEGATVSFDTEIKGDYENIVPKSLEVTEAAPEGDSDAGTDDAPAKGSKPAGAKKPWAGEKGTKVGHAINNAVQIANAAGKAGDLKAIHSYACDIIALGVVLEGQYDRIVETAAERVKAKQAGEATPAAPKAAKAQEPDPEPETPAEKPKPQKAAASKPAPAKAPAPAAAKAPVKAPDPEAGWDDDIPF